MVYVVSFLSVHRFSWDDCSNDDAQHTWFRWYLWPSSCYRVDCRVGEGREWTGYDLWMGRDMGLVSLKVQVEEMGHEWYASVIIEQVKDVDSCHMVIDTCISWWCLCFLLELYSSLDFLRASRLWFMLFITCIHQWCPPVVVLLISFIRSSHVATS